MFAKFAQLPAFARVAARHVQPAAMPCNDNEPVRRGIAVRRPVLIRRWYVAPSGALESSWSIAADGGDDDGVGRSRWTRQRRANRRRRARERHGSGPFDGGGASR